MTVLLGLKEVLGLSQRALEIIILLQTSGYGGLAARPFNAAADVASDVFFAMSGDVKGSPSVDYVFRVVSPDADVKEDRAEDA